jgi:hypothetical protein
MLPLWNLVQCYSITGDSNYLDYYGERTLKGLRNSLRYSPLKFTSDQINPIGGGGGLPYGHEWLQATKDLAASLGYAVFQEALSAKSAGKYYIETGDEDAMDVVIAFGEFMAESGFVRDGQGVAQYAPYCWGDYWGIGITSDGFVPDVLQSVGWAYELTGTQQLKDDMQVGLATWSDYSKNINIHQLGYTLKALYEDRGDYTAPAAVSNLGATGQGTGSVELTWTAPGDDGSSGTAWKYQVKHSKGQIAQSVTGWPDWSAPVPVDASTWRSKAAAFLATEISFVAAINADGEPAPSSAGSSESMIISGLDFGQTYYFAVKTFDEKHNISDISNVVSVTVP